MTDVIPVEDPTTQLGTFVPAFMPLENVSPFTLRDGYSYLEVLQRLRQFINTELVPWMNSQVNVLGSGFVTETNKLIDEVNAALTQNGVDVAAAVAEVNGIADDIRAQVSTVTQAATTAGTAANTATQAATTAGNAATSAQDAATQAQGYAANARKAVIWQPNTAYAAGDIVIAPNGDVVKAKAAFTSGGAYDGTKWTVSSTFAPANLYGTYATRPGATTVLPGTMYYASDTLECYRSNGTIWQVVGSGGNEIAYAQVTSLISTDGTTNPLNVPGLSVTFNAGERPLKAIFQGSTRQNIQDSEVRAYIMVDGVISSIAAARDSLAGGFMTLHTERRMTFTPGSQHTVSVQLLASISGVTDLFASNLDPAFIQVVTL